MKPNLESTVAVVVTYNRKDLLLKCLKGLMAQTKHLQAIYIVDNCSSDGTDELLLKAGFLNEIPSTLSEEPFAALSVCKNIRSEGDNRSQKPDVLYMRTSKNLGGAGGFHEGIKRAYLDGFDWIWLMDDDVVPDDNCLEMLHAGKSESECIQPLRYFGEGMVFNWYHSFEPITGIKFTLPVFENGHKTSAYINYGCFEGMLVSKKIVSKIGYPSIDYFICEDDTLYGFKASLYTNVKYIKGAKMKRLLPFNSKVLGWKSYYVIRNRIWLHKDIAKILNLSTKPHYKYFEFLMIFLWLALSIITLLKSFSNIKPVIRGFFDGLRYRSKENAFDCSLRETK